MQCCPHKTPSQPMIPSAEAVWRSVTQQFSSVSPRCLKTSLNIVMLKAEVGLVSKYNVVLFRCPCPPFIAPLVVQKPSVFSQGLKEAINVLRAF
ncbi:hypothetical protein TNCV_2667131 [Trichonephila clavipes]|nr:hypothetical protein TNCV_2667131 [Trichonephila clavipes]